MRYAAIIGAALLMLAIGLWVTSSRTANQRACTAEAKLCPDGSYVGRTGPNCEFAACPASSATSTIAIGEAATINEIGINVRSLAEDSRCPVDVQCIQAGTVRVHALVNYSLTDYLFTLGKPQVVSGVTITLASVIPAQKYSKQTIAPSDYRFTFTVVPAPPAPASTSGMRGTVSLGPTCPVMREPPNPGCADKPYATAVVAYRTGSNTPYLIGNSDATGAFALPLPPGSYTLSAGGNTTLPRCAPVEVTVTKGAYVTVTIFCDTGIR